MQFYIKKRDGPARIGQFTIENKEVITPNILFAGTSRFKASNFADILITNNNWKTETPKIRVHKDLFLSSKNNEKHDNMLYHNYFVYPKDVPKELHFFSIKSSTKKTNYYVIPANKEIINDAIKDNNSLLFIVENAAQLFPQHSKFLEFIIELREKIGYQKMIYLPSVGDPTNFALLSYLGIDFFDSISAIVAARNNLLLFPTGRYNKNEIQELPCSCPSCIRSKEKPSEMTYSQILNHNYSAIINEIKHVRNAIRQGNLRELVETRVKTSPELTAILRNFDFNHYDFLEERTPIIRKARLIATTKQSLFRPEIKRFQERTIKRYRKPKSAKILLLFPCSAKKPYSFSKSHRLFREILSELQNPYVIHELIVTSPLGIVPRELELIYPASSYDVPVTGYWDEDEKKMIRALLQQYLEINRYDKIIIHLPQDVQDFIKDLFKNSTSTCINKPTSNESLRELLAVLKKSIEPYDLVSAAIRAKENMESFASFQFEKKIAKILLKDCSIRGKYPYHRIVCDNKQIGMLTQERGLISLTMDGAKRLKESGRYWVEIYDDFTLKGSVFAPGIKDADESIRIGDEVIILKNKKLYGVGVAQMNGKEMKESNKGEAVKTRHVS